MQADHPGWRPCRGVPDWHPSGACNRRGHGAIPGPGRGPSPLLLLPQSCQTCLVCPGLGGLSIPPSLAAQGLSLSPVAQRMRSPMWCGGCCTQGRVLVFPTKALRGLRVTSLPITCPFPTLSVLLVPAPQHRDNVLPISWECCRAAEVDRWKQAAACGFVSCRQPLSARSTACPHRGMHTASWWLRCPWHVSAHAQLPSLVCWGKCPLLGCLALPSEQRSPSGLFCPK